MDAASRGLFGKIGIGTFSPWAVKVTLVKLDGCGDVQRYYRYYPVSWTSEAVVNQVYAEFHWAETEGWDLRYQITTKEDLDEQREIWGE